MDFEDRDGVRYIPFIPGHPLSYTTTRIELFSEEESIGVGTGFVGKFGTKYSLITNWHVLSGRNPLTGETLSRTGKLPDRADFHVLVSTNLELGEKKTGVQLFFKPMSIALVRDGQPTWLAVDGKEVRPDVAAIPLNGEVEELENPKTEIRSINVGVVTLTPEAAEELRSNRSAPIPASAMRYLYPRVGSEVFILGYPLGITYSGVFPIWKRGSIASDLQEPVDRGGDAGADLFYVDALTKRGMSGAPVVYFPKEGELLRTHDNHYAESKGTEPLFLGVYAGRDGVTNDEYEMSLGRVWKPECVAKLFLPKDSVEAKSELTGER